MNENTPTPREHENASPHASSSQLQKTRLQRAALCNRCGVAFPCLDLYYDHRCVEKRSGVVGQQSAALRDMALRQVEAGIATTAAKVGGVAGSVLYLLFALACIAAAVLLGCATAPLQTSVRRVDSIAQLDIASEAMAVDGWRIVSVVAEGRGTFVVVYERRAGARWE